MKENFQDSNIGSWPAQCDGVKIGSHLKLSTDTCFNIDIAKKS